MNKPLFNFVKISVLIFVLFFSLGEVVAQITTSDRGPVLPSNEKNLKTQQDLVQEKSTVDKIVNFVAPRGSVLATMFPSTKNCNYVDNKLYQPFSGIDKTFPGANGLGIKELEDRNNLNEKVNVTCIDVSTGGVENILKIFFTLLISIIIIMSVINISISGIQFMTEEASGQIKGGARKRLQNSFIALGLGLLSYTILYTVNRQLVAFNFNPESIDKDGSIEKGIESAEEAAGKSPFSTAVGSIEALQPSTNYANRPDYQVSGNNQGILDTFNNSTVSPGGQRINNEALDMLGQKTCKVDSTNSGKLACAYVVNSIINNALGKPLRGNSGDTDSFGRSTIEMKNDLDKSNRFYFVGTSIGLLLPGDIVISPTVGSNTGHVGIYTNIGKIVSNSSSRTVVDDHFTPSSWLNYYNERKGLITYIYRYRN
jgi:cell wall-associated NlpC family hydrolase